MTKKKRWIPLCIIGCIIALLLSVAAVLGTVRAKGHSITIGRYLELVSHDARFLIDGTSLIALSDGSEQQKLFDALSSGDQIAVVHGAVAESYPAQAEAYHCTRLSRGTDEDIPTEALHALYSLGYFSDGIPFAQVDFKAQYIHSSTDFGEPTYPAAHVIRSVSELLTYYNGIRPTDGDGLMNDHSTPLLEAFNTYDDAYFEDRILILVVLQEGSGSVRHEVTGVNVSGDTLTVAIDELTPEVVTFDMAWWHVLIEPAAGVDVSDESNITVVTNVRRVSDSTRRCCYPLVNDIVAEFSYADAYDAYIGCRFLPGTAPFKNTTVFPTDNCEAAIKRAKAECTVEYTTTDVAFDDTADMWRVCFLPGGNVAGGDQTVYLDTNGITHLIVYGD